MTGSRPRTKDLHGWTEARVARARRLANEGASGSEIAMALGGGLSRNAVLGKLHRLGIALKGETGRNATVKVRTLKMTAPARLTNVKRSASAPPHKPGSLPPEPPRPERLVELKDLTSQHCRWPFGTPGSDAFGFCGAPRHGERVYCAEHCAAAYQALKPLKPIKGV
jgi:GcrA cell cycle regulator